MKKSEYKYSGCGITFGISIIVVIACLVNNKINDNLFVWAIIVGGIILDWNITKIIEKKRKHKNSNNKRISEDYFNQINEATENLVSFYNRLKEDKVFVTIVKAHLKTNGTIKDSDVAYLIFCLDIKTCYDKLQIPVKFSTKEGLGFSIFSKRVLGMSPVQYNQLDTLLSINEESSVILNLLSTINLRLIPNYYLFVADFLSLIDSDMMTQYIVLMYRFASITAKADGIVTEVEQKWLSELLKISNKKPFINAKRSDFADYDPLSEEKSPHQYKEESEQCEVYPTLKFNHQTELQSLIGLTPVKAEISTLANFVKIQQERQSKGLKISQSSYHCVFTGNPGTGKTTIARIVAGIYKDLGILKKGHLVETDRSGLIAEYVGQTAVKTNKIIDTALDGILFIDEAYSLFSDSGVDYGKEAIATLLKRMEDNRDRLVVILAGYSVEMQQFIDSNPGLQSRFNRYIDFPDYSAEELFQIFELNSKQFDYTITQEAIIPLQEYLMKAVANKDKNFGNARFVRNLFEKTIERQANRLSKEVHLTNEKLSEICSIDIPM